MLDLTVSLFSTSCIRTSTYHVPIMYSSFPSRSDGPRLRVVCQTDSRTPVCSTRRCTSRRSRGPREAATTARLRTAWVLRPSSPSGWTSIVSIKLGSHRTSGSGSNTKDSRGIRSLLGLSYWSCDCVVRFCRTFLEFIRN